LGSQNVAGRAYRSIMTAQEELAAAIDGRAGWRLEQAAAIYAPADATAHVRVRAMADATRRHRFAAAIVRAGRAEHSRPCGSAVEAIRWAEGVRLD
jgi:hypothetical protein